MCIDLPVSTEQEFSLKIHRNNLQLSYALTKTLIARTLCTLI